jgi:radical SAM protein with 4Fe4S-binding SPASM domain
MIESVNFSLSGACGAYCIFCPADRAKKITPVTMPLDYASKIVEELSSDSFKKKHTLKRIVIGENGDSFINPHFIDILRLVRKKLPHVPVELVANFQLATEEKLTNIIKENLIDSCICNIDGGSAKTYELVKGLDYKQVLKNVNNFLLLREKLNNKIPLIINILTFHNYVHTIYNNFHVYPLKMTDPELRRIPDDFKETKDKLKNIIDPSVDWIIKTWVYGWAERAQMASKKIDYRKYSCTNIRRIEREAFIAPDGRWYACCVDANYENSYGNIVKTSFDEVFNSDKRKNFIKMIKNRQFEKIGGPCSTVNCCQMLSKNRLGSELLRIIFNHPALVDYYCNLTSKKNSFFLTSILKLFSSLPYFRTKSGS